jgi:hypothetical protein
MKYINIAKEILIETLDSFLGTNTVISMEINGVIHEIRKKCDESYFIYNNFRGVRVSKDSISERDLDLAIETFLAIFKEINSSAWKLKQKNRIKELIQIYYNLESIK